MHEPVVRMGPIERALTRFVNVQGHEAWMIEQCRIADRTLTATTCVVDPTRAERLFAHVQGAMSSVCKYLSWAHSWSTASGFETKVLEALQKHGFKTEQ